MKHPVAVPQKRLLVSALLIALSAPVAAQTAPEPQEPPTSAADPTPGNSATNAGNSAVDLDAVQVKGIRGSMVSSMNLKRDAQGVVDGIVAEDIGKFPDTNLAESLQRISGVSIDRSNGEGSKVTVRGVGPDFNLVLLNGRQMPTATGGRAFEFSDLASESISAVDVYKTSRASTPVGGIGATINIKTGRPLDNPGFHASAGVKGVMDTSDDDLPGKYEGSSITPEISGIFSNTFGGDRFGISLSASRQERESGSARAEVASGNGWKRYSDTPLASDPDVSSGLPLPGTPGSENITNRPGPNDIYVLPQSLGYAINSVHRQRTNGQAVLQFAPTDNLTATLDYTFSENKIQSQRNDMSAWFNLTPDVSSWTPGSGSSPLYLHESYNCTPREQDAGCSDFAMAASKTAVARENKSLGFNVAWQVNDAFSVNLDYHDSSAESRPDSPYGTSNSMSTAGFYRAGASADFSGEFPILNLELPPGQTAIDPAQEQATGSVFHNDYQKATIKQLQLSGQFQFENYSKLDFGVSNTDYKNRSAFTNVQLDTWGGNVPAGPAAYPDSAFPIAHMGDYFDEFSGANSPQFSDAFFLFDFETMRQLASDARTNAGLGVPEDYLPSFDYTGATVPGTTASRTVGNSLVREKSRSAYVQWSDTIDLTMPLDVAVGVRYEDTEVTSTALQPAPVLVNWASENEYNLVYQGSEYVSRGGDYKYWLPSLDLALALNDTMKLRFSASKTIGRPNWSDLNAAQALGSPARYDGGSGGSGNPALKPLVSKNLDLSYEWYYGEGSYVSIGYFYKKIDNFIASQAIRGTPISDLTTPTGGAYWNEALAAGCVTTNRVCIRDYIFANHDGDPGVNAATGSIVGQPGDPTLEFNITQPVNNRSDKLDGWELNIQHVFGETGFGFSANYTKVDSGLTYDNGLLGTQFALTGLSDSANFVAFYDKGQWQVRAAYNWRDQFLNSLADGKGSNPQYVEAYGQLDMNVGYKIGDHLTLSVEAINLTNETARVHGRNTHQLYSLDQFGPRYMFGARYTF
jgi:TonB-dependent receptor